MSLWEGSFSYIFLLRFSPLCVVYRAEIENHLYLAYLAFIDTFLALEYKKLKLYDCVYVCVLEQDKYMLKKYGVYFWGGIDKLDYCHFKWERI